MSGSPNEEASGYCGAPGHVQLLCGKVALRLDSATLNQRRLTGPSTLRVTRLSFLAGGRVSAPAVLRIDSSIVDVREGDPWRRPSAAALRPCASWLSQWRLPASFSESDFSVRAR